jgi:pimeloyl-ACP methyl ester carboxylesterase
LKKAAKVIKHRFDLRAAGRWLHAERIVPEQAAAYPTLVFLHEGLGSIPQWKEFPAQLCAATGLSGLVYERWGFGRSEPLTEQRTTHYLHYEARESLPRVLEACAIDQPPILIGHSDGGTIALLFAAAYPDRTRAIITEAAHVFVEEVTLAGIRKAKRLYQSTDLPRHLARYHGENTDAMFRGWCDTWLRPDFRNWNMEAELPAIICPALIIQGEDDEYGTPAQVEAIAAGVSGPVQTWLIPHCGHIPHHQAREAVLQKMQTFIAGVLEQK